MMARMSCVGQTCASAASGDTIASAKPSNANIGRTAGTIIASSPRYVVPAPPTFTLSRDRAVGYSLRATEAYVTSPLGQSHDIDVMRSLPPLQFALREMWGRLDKRRMTHTIYEAIGRVEGTPTTCRSTAMSRDSDRSTIASSAAG